MIPFLIYSIIIFASIAPFVRLHDTLDKIFFKNENILLERFYGDLFTSLFTNYWLAINLQLHAANSVLLYIVGCKLLKSYRQYNKKIYQPCCCIVAVLFAVHPSRIEIMISSPTTTLALFLGLVSVTQFLKFVDEVNRPSMTPIYFVLFVCFSLASTIVDVTYLALPIVLVLAIWGNIISFSPNKWSRRIKTFLSILYAILLLARVIMWLKTQTNSVESVTVDKTVNTFVSSIYCISVILGRYLLIAWPEYMPNVPICEFLKHTGSLQEAVTGSLLPVIYGFSITVSSLFYSFIVMMIRFVQGKDIRGIDVCLYGTAVCACAHYVVLAQYKEFSSTDCAFSSDRHTYLPSAFLSLVLGMYAGSLVVGGIVGWVSSNILSLHKNILRKIQGQYPPM